MSGNLMDKITGKNADVDNDGDTDTNDLENTPEVPEGENEVKQPPGFYSEHCNVIHVGNGFKYDWPPNSPFPMDKVQERHQKQVLLDINTMIQRGYAYEVKADVE